MRISSGLIAQTVSKQGWRGGVSWELLGSSDVSFNHFSLICSLRTGTHSIENSLTAAAAKAALAGSILTLHGRPFGENGDGAFSHPLLANHGGDLGAPTVRPHPQEVTRLVVPLGRSEDASVGWKSAVKFLFSRYEKSTASWPLFKMIYES